MDACSHGSVREEQNMVSFSQREYVGLLPIYDHVRYIRLVSLCATFLPVENCQPKKKKISDVKLREN